MIFKGAGDDIILLMQTDTAVIVINHNGKEHLQECFSSLLAQSYSPLNLYMLDNASTDGSREFVREHFPAVTILAMDKGYGFAGGFNRGVSLVREEFIGLVSNDTRVDPRWVEYMRGAMAADRQAAIAGCKVLFYDRPGMLNSAGQCITPLGMGFETGFGLPDQPRFNRPGAVASVCGAAMMVRKGMFERLGGFDESYFLLAEETDLCWRAWIAGYTVIYEPRAFILHKYGATIGKRETPLRVFRTQRNSIASVIKNRQDIYLGTALAGCIAVACARIIGRLLSGENALLKAQLDGLLALLPMLPQLLRKRRKLQAGRCRSDATLDRLKLFASWPQTIREFIRIKKLGT